MPMSGIFSPYFKQIKPHMLKRYPQLADIDTEGLTEKNFNSWLNLQKSKFGDYLYLDKIPSDEYKNVNVYEAVENIISRVNQNKRMQEQTIEEEKTMQSSRNENTQSGVVSTISAIKAIQQSKELLFEQKNQLLKDYSELLNYKLIQGITQGEIMPADRVAISACIEYGVDVEALAKAVSISPDWTFKDVETLIDALPESQGELFKNKLSGELKLYFERKEKGLESFEKGEVSSLDIKTFGSDKLITQQQFRKEILPKLPSNVFLIETDSSYAPEKRQRVEPNDFVVFLVGPTNHQAVTSQWRIQVIKEVSERMREFLLDHPKQRLVFVNPQYPDSPSKGFRGHGEDQIRWEKNYLDLADLTVIYGDLRFKNPDGTTGNVGLTVRNEMGAEVFKSEIGKGSTIAFLPKDSIGTDWTEIHSKYAAAERLIENQFTEEMDREKVYDAITRNPQDVCTEAKKRGGPTLSVDELRGYSETLENFYDTVTRKLKKGWALKFDHEIENKKDQGSSPKRVHSFFQNKEENNNPVNYPNQNKIQLKF